MADPAERAWQEWARRFATDDTTVAAVVAAARHARVAGATDSEVEAAGRTAASDAFAASWRSWAASRFADEPQAEAAAAAALKAALAGADSDQAALAGRKAASELSETQSRTAVRAVALDAGSTHSIPPPLAPQPLAGHVGSPVTAISRESYNRGRGPVRGRASRVQQRQEMHGGKYWYIWEFSLSREGLPLIPVEMRGLRFDGVVMEGDEIEIDQAPKPGTVLHTRRVMNLTLNAPLRVRGIGQVPVPAQYVGLTVKVVIGIALIIIFVVGFVAAAIAIMHASNHRP